MAQQADRRIASSQVLLATTHADIPSRSRRVFSRELLVYFPPSSIRGRGEAGRPMRPIAACAMIVVERTRVSQVTPESPGTPRAVVLQLITRSPRRSDLGLSPSSAVS